jgi:outer membrane cobalamin receptor
MVVVFQHIAYFKKEIPLGILESQSNVELRPRVIPLRSVEVVEEGLPRLEIRKDLPQTVSVIEARNFEIRGYVDAGDLLRVDHSVQVEEELSGKKTVALRGGNADEVVVLFDGVKMNNAYDNTFDMSLIDLEDVQRFEVIKGSNTALYGPEAFSGVINIVPKIEQDYNIRFQQRLGTYRSGNWGLHLYKKLDRLHGSYSLKRGGLTREFVDIPEDQGGLENRSLHQTANVNYQIGRNAIGRPKGTLGAMWLYTSLDYENRRNFEETLDNFNNLLSLKYSGELLGLRDFDLSMSFKNFDESQNFASSGAFRKRDIEDRTLYLNLQKQFQISDLDLLIGYRFQRSELDFLDSLRTQSLMPIGLERGDLKRTQHGLVGILKYHGDAGSEFFQTVDVDVSIGHDRVRNSQSNAVLRGDEIVSVPGQTPGLFENQNWRETMAKLSFNLAGYQDDLSFNSYLNFGANTKFPTLFQLVSSPAQSSDPSRTANLSPEKNRSLEFGVNLGRDIRDHKNVYGWQVSGNYFQNHYDNKFVEISSPSSAISEFENVDNAKISGFETKSSVFLFQKKISAELGLSKYFISERTAFPFKSDHKRTLTFNVNHAGYSFQILWFKEGEQTGRARFNNGTFGEFTLPSATNVDLHFSKTFELWGIKLFGNASGRNLLNDDTVFEGLALRDRRFYITLGAQY